MESYDWNMMVHYGTINIQNHKYLCGKWVNVDWKILPFVERKTSEEIWDNFRVPLNWKANVPLAWVSEHKNYLEFVLHYSGLLDWDSFYPSQKSDPT